MFLRFASFALIALLLFSSGAGAQQYIQPTWPDLARTLIRLNAMDIKDQLVLDEFGIVTECDLYDTFYHDDFKWNKVRIAMRKSIRQNIAAYPTRYRHDIEMQLDRYDFSTRTFMFREKSKVHNDNVIQLYTVPLGTCHMEDIQNIPLNFVAVLHPPLFLEGIPLPEADAKNLVMRMERDKNFDRIIYASYNLKIVYIEPLRKKRLEQGVFRYRQEDQKFTVIKVDATIESIDFYEDPKYKRLIYHMPF